MPWRRSLWIWNAAGRPCGEETKETKKRRRKDGDKAEDADRREASVRWELGGRGDWCASVRVGAPIWRTEPHVALRESWLVHLYGEAARFFFFFPTPRWSSAPIWGSHSQELGSSTAIRIGMWHDKSTNKKGVGRGGLAGAPIW